MQPQPYPQQPPMPQYPQPQYPAPYGQPQQYQPYPQQPAPPPAPVQHDTSLSSFFSQPSDAGGPSFKFKDKPNGTKYAGIVARPITDADVRVKTNPSTGEAQTYRDGRPKEVLVVPMLVPQSPEFPDGFASWWVSGQARDELLRAMREAGAPEGPPEEGAGVTVEKTGERPIPGFNPKYIYRVTYVRPQGATQAPAEQPGDASAALASPSAPDDVQAQASAAPAEPAPAATTAGMSDDQAALFAKLTGNG